MDSSQLIEAVKRRVALYDRLNPNYGNRNFINAQWREIGAELKCSDVEARKKWTQIRDYFQKACREMSTSGCGKNTKKKWYLYDSVKFLIPYVKDTKGLSNFSEEIPNDQDDTSSFASLSPVSCKVEEIEPEVSEESNWKQTAPQNRTILQARKRKEPEPKIIDRGTLHHTVTQTLTQQQDEDELFLRSLAPKMKLMNIYQKMQCQSEITMIVLKHIKLSDQSAHPHRETAG